MAFIQARNYTKGRTGKIRLLVCHDMEAGQSKGTAESVANYFHNQPAGNDGSSAHCCVDQDSIVDCVLEADTAWAAPNANSIGLHIEHAGYAKETQPDWLSDANKAMLEISAARAAHWAIKYGIPVKRLTVAELRAGAAGFAGHVDITNAFNGGSGHTDPGPNFPWDFYLTRVKAHVQAQNPAPKPAAPAKPAQKPAAAPVAPVPSWYKRELAEGARGADVHALQKRLIAKGFKLGTPDGIFGEATRKALVAFQRKAKLLVDGKCGPNTARKLGK